MKTNNDHEQLASYLASLGDDFPQLSFALNNPGAPNTVYIGADPKANAGLQFQITTSTDTTLTPGAPVPIDQAPNVSYSLLYLDLTPFNLSDAEFTNIALANGSGWGALPDLASRTICLAPQGQSIPVSAGTDGVSLALTGFAVANPPSGSTVPLSVTYYTVAGITIDNFPSVTPLEVALLPPPDQHDNNLHDDIFLSVQPALVVCSKDPYPPVPNTLTIQFSPGPQGRPVIAGKETVFEVHFVYAEAPGSGALCTAAQGANFVPARGTNAQQWDEPLVIKTQEPYVSLKPPADAVIVGSGVGAVVTFDIGNIITNLQPGATLMLVTYSGIPNYQAGSFQFVLTKVPHVDITSLEVTPNPAELEKEDGVDVVIDWVTHDAGALRLTSSDGLDQDVTRTLSFRTTITQTTDFHLDADGIYGANLDNKATKPTTAVVLPYKLSLSCDVSPPAVGINGLARLRWEALNGVSCTLDDGTILPASGTRYFILTKTRCFTLTAHGRFGQTRWQQATVEVDPSIVPTEQGYQVTGAAGKPGDNADPFSRLPTAGGPGGDGDPASFSKTVPPLDDTSNPKRVIPIILKGGDGGWGGWGGDAHSFAQAGGNGGNGGNGGDVSLDLVLDSAAGNPAQFILTLSPGAGGKGGAGGTGWWLPWQEGASGANGEQGSVKTISIKEKEQGDDND